MSWTDEKIEELKKLWSEGITTGEIGRRLNMSKNSVVGKVHRLGLSGRPSPIKKKPDDSSEEPKKTTKVKSKTPKPTIKPETKSPQKEPEVVAKEKKQTPPPSKNVAPKPLPEKTEIKQEATSEADIKLAQSLDALPKNEPKRGFIGLTDLDNHTCRWPIGDPKDENFHFCGKKVRLGQTYCEEHSMVAYVKPNKK